MVIDVIEELLVLDVEPKPESLRWTSSCEEEDKITLQVGGGKKNWEWPFREVFGVLGYRYQRDGQSTQGVGKDTTRRDGQLVAKLTLTDPKVML